MAMSFGPIPALYALLRNRACQDLAFRLALAVAGGDRKPASDGALPSVGSARTGQAVTRRAASEVPAYRDFMSRERPNGAWAERPAPDKADYIRRYAVSQLLGGDWKDTFTIFRSSGSSGKPHYWPQLKSAHRFTKWAFRFYLEHCFGIHRRKTIAIVGLSLGSWIGGDYLSWLLKCVALDARYPFCVFAPGNHHTEIIEMIADIQGYADQIILFVCPSAIGHLHLLAEQRGVTLPFEKLRYMVLGEPFPESLRLSLAGRAGVSPAEGFLFSVYGSADTGTLGIELPASVAIRQLLAQNPALAQEIGIADPVPHLFHFCAPGAFLESVDGELCVTRWQGIPLVRYNLHDSARFLDWPWLRASVLSSRSIRSADQSLVNVVRQSSSALPAILAIPGRADRCLILCGTNLTEAMLAAAIGCRDLDSILTGAYEARIEYENERQYLSLDLELKPGPEVDTALDRRVYSSLVSELGRVQPEFLDDWRNMYQTWDDDQLQRILRINYHAWPAISKSVETEPKQKGVRS